MNVTRWKERQGMAIEQWRAKKGVEKANQGSGGFPGAGIKSKWCLNSVAEYSHNLTLKPSFVFHHCIGKVVQMWNRTSSFVIHLWVGVWLCTGLWPGENWQSLKFSGRDFQEQVLISHTLRPENIYFWAKSESFVNWHSLPHSLAPINWQLMKRVEKGGRVKIWKKWNLPWC